MTKRLPPDVAAARKRPLIAELLKLPLLTMTRAALLREQRLCASRSCPECGRDFFPIRKQKYCTSTCQDRDRKRRHRQGEPPRFEPRTPPEAA